MSVPEDRLVSFMAKLRPMHDVHSARTGASPALADVEDFGVEPIPFERGQDRHSGNQWRCRWNQDGSVRRWRRWSVLFSACGVNSLFGFSQLSGESECFNLSPNGGFRHFEIQGILEF